MTNELIKNELVNIILAKLLKEVGFDKVTRYTYDKDSNLNITSGKTNSTLPDNCYSCPNIYEAQNWVEKALGMYCIIIPTYYNRDGCVTYRYRTLSLFDLYDKKKGKLNKDIYEYRNQALNNALIDCIEDYKKIYKYEKDI